MMRRRRNSRQRCRHNFRILGKRRWVKVDKSSPGRKHAIALLRRSGQIRLPASYRCRNDVILLQNLIEALVRILLHLGLRDQIIGHARSQPHVRIVASLGKRVVVFRLPLAKLFLELLICFISHRRLSSRRQCFNAILKHAIQRVIVPRRNWIVLVVVATRNSPSAPLCRGSLRRSGRR